MLHDLIKTDWKQLFTKEDFSNLESFLISERQSYNIFPDQDKIFEALNLTSFEQTKVVILGQDPYYNKNQANGLSFSTNSKQLPRSLINIYKELNDDLGIEICSHGLLHKWANEGILLLNSTLTVRENQPNSHAHKVMWSRFTNKIIKELNKKQDVVFIFWGYNNKDRSNLIDQEKHLVIFSSHPSPQSAHKGFFQSKCFSKANQHLISKNIQPIDWNLVD